MADKTNIGWTNRTLNFWKGCTKKNEECRFCYAATLAKRGGWDFSKVTRCGRDIWRKPDRWNKEAAEAGRVDLVFTCSISDFFHPAADAWRDEAWDVIRRNKNLAWQILTKALVAKDGGLSFVLERLPKDWGDGWDHVWIGSSAGQRDTFATTAHHLRNIPAATRFLSMEPLLELIPVEDFEAAGDLSWLDQAIIGGESGTHLATKNEQWQHRRMDLVWARTAAAQFLKRHVAVMFKQRSDVKNEQPADCPWLDGLKQWPLNLFDHQQHAKEVGLIEGPNPRGYPLRIFS